MTPLLLTYDRDADATWRLLSQAGNQAMRAGDLNVARERYLEAYAEADRLFCEALSDACDAPVAVIQVISCKNLADAFNAKRDRGKMQFWLRRGFERLAATMEDEMAPFRVRAQCLSQLKFAYLHLVEVARSAADRQILSDLSVRGRAAVARVITELGKVEQLADPFYGSGPTAKH